ncbi:MAG: 23S rRNA (guanosine(2251)-2'-O)-methyltransferase RlmB [bacterium]|nr:23S rRNA (guanosine(2251)-2'-O)-methyltransferase RlmB [bacterium]
MKQTKLYIYGKHALWEALLHAPKALLKIYFEPRSLDAKFKKLIKDSGVPTASFGEGRAKADMRSGAPHQDIIGQVSLHQLVVLYQKFSETLSSTPHTSLVVLNGVQDPHNVGAIIRSAAGFGAAGVLLPEKEQAPVTGTVLKVSAGMAFRIPLVTVSDLHATIYDLKKRRFKVYALAGEGQESLTKEQFTSPTLFILGNEAKGITPGIRALCDKILSIPISSRTESLNVAASSAIAMYAWSAQHPEALTNAQTK